MRFQPRKKKFKPVVKSEVKPLHGPDARKPLLGQLSFAWAAKAVDPTEKRPEHANEQ
jgi:hypothetical protein